MPYTSDSCLIGVIFKNNSTDDLLFCNSLKRKGAHFDSSRSFFSHLGYSSSPGTFPHQPKDVSTQDGIFTIKGADIVFVCFLYFYLSSSFNFKLLVLLIIVLSTFWLLVTQYTWCVNLWIAFALSQTSDKLKNWSIRAIVILLHRQFCFKCYSSYMKTNIAYVKVYGMSTSPWVHVRDTIFVSSTVSLNNSGGSIFSPIWYFGLINFSVFSDYKRTLITFKLKTRLILITDSSQSFSINSYFIYSN